MHFEEKDMTCIIPKNKSIAYMFLIAVIVGSQVSARHCCAYGDTYDLKEQPAVMDQTTTQSTFLKGRVHRDDAGQTQSEDSDQVKKINRWGYRTQSYRSIVKHAATASKRRRQSAPR